ncbi:MAG TPA: hypothetical protein VN914_01795, partial [Polyangia bacterium]|nr:hypothetical protein [Polyangia bacterium]
GSCLSLKENGVDRLELDCVALKSNSHTDAGALSIELYQISAPGDPNGFPGKVFLDETFRVRWTFSSDRENVTATVFLL